MAACRCLGVGVAIIVAQSAWGGPMPFTEEVAAPGTRVTYLHPADFDNDGLLDCGAIVNNQTIAWFENLGGATPAFTQHTLRTYSGWGLASILAYDIDPATDVDLHVTVNDSVRNGVTLWINLMAMGPPAPDWMEAGPNLSHFVPLHYRYVFPADLDADGKSDSILSLDPTDRLITALNRGSPLNIADAVRIPDTDDNPRDVCAGDMDGDNDTDVVFTSRVSSGLYWYENDGTGDARDFVLHTIATSLTDLGGVFAGDIDADGDTDVVATRESAVGTLWWFENDGASPPSFTQRSITSFLPFNGWVLLVDIDGDDDLDVFPTTDGDNSLLWYENTGGSPATFTQHTIPSAIASHSQLMFGDVNRDGAADILATSDQAGADWHWFKNNSIIRNLSAGSEHATLGAAVALVSAGDRLLLADAQNRMENPVDFGVNSLELRFTGGRFSLPRDSGTLTLRQGSKIIASPDRVFDYGSESTLLAAGGTELDLGCPIEVVAGASDVLLSARGIFFVYETAPITINANASVDFKSLPSFPCFFNGDIDLEPMSSLRISDVASTTFGGSGSRTRLNSATLNITGDLTNNKRLSAFNNSVMQVVGGVTNSHYAAITESALIVTGSLTHLLGGLLELTDAAIVAGNIQFDAGSDVTGSGQFTGNVTNNGTCAFDEMKSNSDFTNNGSVTVSAGNTFTITGTFTNNGTATGNIVSRSGNRASGGGILAIGGLVSSAASTLGIPEGCSLELRGGADIAIDDPARFRFADSEIRFNHTAPQDFEVMSADIGDDSDGLDDSQPGAFPIGKVRIMPGAIVNLVDNHDNDGQGQGSSEVIYTPELIVKPGATLNTNGIQVFASSITIEGSIDDPANVQQIVPCDADADGNGVVNADDVGYVIFRLGNTGLPGTVDGDVNNDGIVDTGDIAFVIFRFGAC